MFSENISVRMLQEGILRVNKISRSGSALIDSSPELFHNVTLTDSADWQNTDQELRAQVAEVTLNEICKDGMNFEISRNINGDYVILCYAKHANQFIYFEKVTMETYADSIVVISFIQKPTPTTLHLLAVGSLNLVNT